MSSFGRLQIYLPDSPVENFYLQKQVVAIGRSTGNDLVLDRNGISRYHAKLTVEEQQASLTDLESVNGVYVDGVRIEANEPRILRGGEEIQLADVRLVYYPVEVLQDDTIPSFSADTTQYIETEQLALHVSGPDMAVVPGSHVQALLVIDNLSDEVHRYQVSVDGIPAEWVRLERTEVEIEPKDQTKIMASFKPLRRSETHPGTYTLTFNVRPKKYRDLLASVQSKLVVGSYSGYGAMMGTPIIEGSQPFRMHVHNQGNDRLVVNFRGIDPQSTLDFAIDPPRVILTAGERRSVYGRIKPQNGNLFGSPRKYRYDIIAHAEDSSNFQAPVSGLYVSKPLLPAWMATVAIPLVAVVVIGLVVLLIAVFGGGEEPLVPAVTVFSAVQEEVVLGDPVTLQWDVVNPGTMRIEYARPNQPPQVVTVDNPNNTYQLMLQTSGVYTVTLHVENTGGRESSITVVRVLPDINTFSADPNTLISHISQDIEFTWSAVGADEVDGKTTVALESQQLSVIQAVELPEQGSQVFTVRPIEPVSVTLRVTGRDGTENTSTLALAVEQARCMLSNPRAVVYTGPDRAYEALATIEESGAIVNPVARNVENTWLQVNYENGLAWVRVADFACEGFTTDQLDPEVDIPPPPPSATPTITLTPSPTPTDTLLPSATPTNTSRPTRTPRATPTAR